MTTPPLFPRGKSPQQIARERRALARQIRTGTYQRGPAGRAYERAITQIVRYNGMVSISRARDIGALQDRLNSLGHTYYTDAMVIQIIRYEQDSGLPQGWTELRLTRQIEAIYEYRNRHVLGLDVNETQGHYDYEQMYRGYIETRPGEYEAFYMKPMAPPAREWWFYR